MDMNYISKVEKILQLMMNNMLEKNVSIFTVIESNTHKRKTKKKPSGRNKTKKLRRAFFVI